MSHLVVHTHVHTAARDAGLSPREQRRLLELREKKRRTELDVDERGELRDLELLSGRISRDAALHIDVEYGRGPMGPGKERTTRHYVVEEPVGTANRVTRSNHGPASVMVELRKIPEHQEMRRAGWTAEKISGYNRDAERPEATYHTTYFYGDGTSETVVVRLSEDLNEEQVRQLSSRKRRYQNKDVLRRDGPYRQLDLGL